MVVVQLPEAVVQRPAYVRKNLQDGICAAAPVELPVIMVIAALQESMVQQLHILIPARIASNARRIPTVPITNIVL